MTSGPVALRPTFDDLKLHTSLSSRLLDAKVHVAGNATPRGFRRLRDAVTATRGQVDVGDEPGSDAYIADTGYRLIRTGALGLAQVDPTAAESGLVPVAAYAFVEQGNRAGDIVVAKDGPVGQVGLLHRPRRVDMLSSGFVRVRLPGESYFHAAVMKYGSFTDDIDLLTPRTSSYRHAGREVLLDALLPIPAAHAAAASRLSLLMLVLSRCEYAATTRIRGLVRVIDAALGTASTPLLGGPTSQSYRELVSTLRLDARRHTARSGPLGVHLDGLPHTTLAELESSGALTIRRAQNLQFDAIGFSDKQDEQSPGAYRLLEPNMIRRDMTTPVTRWLSCATRLAPLPDEAVLMSAEGSIGNVALFKSDPDVRTVGNIHMFVMQPQDVSTAERDAAWLAACLIWLREKGWLEAVSAGGQGGSLGKNYHGDVLLPALPDPVVRVLQRLLAGSSPPPSATDLATAPMEDLRRFAEIAHTMSTTWLDAVKRNAVAAIGSAISQAFPGTAAP